MVIIKAELLPEKEEIHNEVSLLLEWVSPSSTVFIDNLEFYTKSRSRLVAIIFLPNSSKIFPSRITN